MHKGKHSFSQQAAFAQSGVRLLDLSADDEGIQRQANAQQNQGHHQNVLRILFETCDVPCSNLDGEYFVIATLVGSSFPQPSLGDTGFTSRAEYAKGGVVKWEQVTEFYPSAIEPENLGAAYVPARSPMS
jgi:hypothetical protein